MENEQLIDNDSDDGGEIDDNPENTSEQIKNVWVCVLTLTLAKHKNIRCAWTIILV